MNHILPNLLCTNTFSYLTPAPAVIKDIATAFGTTATVVNLSVGFYSLAVAVILFESYSQQAIYLISFFLLVIVNDLPAISVDIGMFIAMRILAGGACACVQAVGAGTISDLWDVKERGSAMGIFFLGPLLSPVVGGAVAIKWTILCAEKRTRLTDTMKVEVLPFVPKIACGRMFG